MPNSTMFKLFCVGLLGSLVLAPHAEAVIVCNVVYSTLSPCLGYIGGSPLNPGCCPAIRSLLGKVNAKPDRQSLCGCLKNLAVTYASRVPKAREILQICGVTLPFPLDPKVDCSRVN